MKRTLIAILFALAIVALYYFVNIQLFSLDITKNFREQLFNLRNEPPLDYTVVLFNVGKLELPSLEEKIDQLLTAEPAKIGINLCHWETIPQEIINKYKTDNRVVFANCKNGQPGSLSRVIDDNGVVTLFKSDVPTCFELQLTGFKGRGNETERINFGPKLPYYVNKKELTDGESWFTPDNIKGKTVLIGYMGDYLADSVYDYRNCRITPLNQYYGESNIPPDMYDTEISAHILRTINTNDFINEVNPIARVLIILAFTLINVVVLTFAKTKWLVVTLIIAAVLFIFLTAAGSLTIVYMFSVGYYLPIDELPLILLITTIFMVISNLIEKPAKA